MGEIENNLFKKLEAIERLTAAPKWKKMAHQPLHYFQAQFFRHLIYPLTKKGKMTTTTTFFGTNMKLQLPSAMDIYLWGTKTHDSEVRLAKFLIRNLKKNDKFMDVGVHFGFFSLLAAKLVGTGGQITSIEASPEMYSIFRENSKSIAAISALNIAASAQSERLSFYEFPILYSEYNTLFPDQYKKEQWYQKFKARKVSIQAHPLDKIIQEEGLQPSIIKIDVEGAELNVLQGLKHYLQSNTPIIVMEYLNQKSHQEAIAFAKTYQYQTYLIASDGQLKALPDLPLYWKANGIDSDNIVLLRE